MTRMEQIQFVEQLVNSVKGDIQEAIRQGDIPQEWDGIELREYLFEKFQDCRMKSMLKGKRGKDYRNVIICSSVL